MQEFRRFAFRTRFGVSFNEGSYHLKVGCPVSRASVAYIAAGTGDTLPSGRVGTGAGIAEGGQECLTPAAAAFCAFEEPTRAVRCA